MVVHLKIFSLAVLLLSFQSIHCDEPTELPKDDLMESESKDPTKVEIIKQIKRVNDDGSYTFGYEAEDGTFKIESRDVLGNIKGTFGFVDTDGEIKRVSYSTTNSTETATVSSAGKDSSSSSVIQQIPKSNRTSSTTRRPNVIYPSPSSTVIQSIPRRRPSSSSSNSSASTSPSSSSNDRPSYKNIAKSSDFEITTTARSSTTESTPTRSSSTVRPGHYIRSTISPQSDSQRFTEGQLIRPTQPDNVTPRPTETSYPRRLIVARNQYLDEGVSSTIKPIVEESYDDNVRGNLLRRQLNQEKVSGFDARQHVLSLQQSVGDDSTDVYSASLTTGTPRPLFTTTDRSRIYAAPTVATIKGITPAKYQAVYQKNPIRGPRPTPQNYIQETTTDSTNTDTNYASPTSVPVLQIPNSEESQVQQIPVVRSRHPFHRGAILIPVNQLQGGRFIVQEPQEEDHHPQYITQYAVPSDQQYLRESSQIQQVPYQIIPRRRPVGVPVSVPVQLDDYHRPQNLFTPREQYPVPVQLNPADIQDEIDSIKPPVSTKDFQKLLNRLILRQSQLQEISRLESRMQQQTYVPERYQRLVQPTPVSVFVRTRPDNRHHTNGPVQFVGQPQNSRSRPFISIPQNQQHIPMQKLMESQQQFHTADPYDNYNPSYRSGRRVARLLHPASRPKEDDENFLPADVREMLLLRMLQLAINPNLPIQPTEGETMATAIRQHKKEAVRNVEIIGEERDEEKPVSRNKRYRESDEYEYY